MISSKFSSCSDTILPDLSSLSNPWKVVAARKDLAENHHMLTLNAFQASMHTCMPRTRASLIKDKKEQQQHNKNKSTTSRTKQHDKTKTTQRQHYETTASLGLPFICKTNNDIKIVLITWLMPLDKAWWRSQESFHPPPRLELKPVVVMLTQKK